jgi:hypothetical protein
MIKPYSSSSATNRTLRAQANVAVIWEIILHTLETAVSYFNQAIAKTPAMHWRMQAVSAVP